MRGRDFVALIFVWCSIAFFAPSVFIKALAQEKAAAPVPAKVAEIAAALTDTPKPAPEPTVSEVVALRLDGMISELDKWSAFFQKAQAEMGLAQEKAERAKSDAQAYALMQQKPGYTLAKQNGKWIYVKQGPPTAAPDAATSASKAPEKK